MNCKRCGLPLAPTELTDESFLCNSCELQELRKVKPKMISDVFRITEHWKTKWCKNPISGHEWLEQVKLLGYHVHSMISPPSFHKTLQAAEKEHAANVKFYKKYFPEMLYEK